MVRTKLELLRQEILKYIGLKDEIVTDENGETIVDENDHVVLED